jgi:hypothetical protein
LGFGFLGMELAASGLFWVSGFGVSWLVLGAAGLCWVMLAFSCVLQFAEQASTVLRVSPRSRVPCPVSIERPAAHSECHQHLFEYRRAPNTFTFQMFYGLGQEFPGFSQMIYRGTKRVVRVFQMVYWLALAPRPTHHPISSSSNRPRRSGPYPPPRTPVTPRVHHHHLPLPATSTARRAPSLAPKTLKTHSPHADAMSKRLRCPGGRSGSAISGCFRTGPSSSFSGSKLPLLLGP